MSMISSTEVIRGGMLGRWTVDYGASLRRFGRAQILTHVLGLTLFGFLGSTLVFQVCPLCVPNLTDRLIGRARLG